MTRPPMISGAVLVVALLAALAACTPTPPAVLHDTARDPSPVPYSKVTVEQLDVGVGETWQVGVASPSPLPPEECALDSSVASSIMSADLPSSRVSYSLHVDSDAADAERVADCIAGALTSGEVTISPPA